MTKQKRHIRRNKYGTVYPAGRLKGAIKSLAMANIRLEKLKKAGYREEDVYSKTIGKSWQGYLKAGGSLSMINPQLKRREDFGHVYHSLAKRRVKQ